MQTSDVTQIASQAVEKSQSFVSSQIQNRTAEIGRQITSTAQGLRRVANDLRDVNAPGAPELTMRSADALERAGRYLQAADVDQLVGDLETFARERPLVVMTGALFAGFAASRMLKAASAERYQSYDYRTNYYDANDDDER